MAEFAPEARATLHEWIHDIAAEAEHRTWQEVVRFTNRHARALIERGHLSRTLVFDMEDNFSQKAARIGRLLSEDYEAHAHPRSA